MKITELFSTPLFFTNVELENKDIYPSITNTKFVGSDHLSMDTDVLNNSFLFLKPFVDNFVSEIMNQFGFDDFCVYSSWLTRVTNLNCPKYDHMHTNSFLSGVVYLQNNSSPLLLRHPMPWRWSSGKSNSITTSGYVYDPNCGDIIVFPSHIFHKILPPEDETTRYSVAFNVIPKGNFGILDSNLTL